MAYVVDPTELQKALNAPLNDFQKALLKAAAHLPPISSGGNILEDIESHVENLVKGIMPGVPNHQTAISAVPFINEKLRTFMSNVFK